MKAFLGLSVPENIVEKLKIIDLPGEKQDSSSYHITMIYFGSDVSMTDLILPAIGTVFDFAGDQKSFLLEADKVDSFPKGEDGIPIIVPIVSAELKKCRANLAKVLDQNKIEYSKKFPEYRPHLTLSYDAENETFKSQKLPQKLSWMATELVLYAGYPGPDNIKVQFPLGLNKEAKASFLTDFFMKIS